MPTYTSDRESCHKSGVILTCYVDGHKRFRALCGHCGDGFEDSVQHESAYHNDSGGSRHTVVLPKRKGRPN
jgi:hypothetical protein